MKRYINRQFTTKTGKKDAIGSGQRGSDILTFYWSQSHWLFMDKTKVLTILQKLRGNIPLSQQDQLHEAIRVIESSTPEKVNELRDNYFTKKLKRA